jgi:predicted dehydrogenase
MIGFMKRFHPSYRLVREVIADGRLGDVFEARARWDNARAYASVKTSYRHARAAGGGFLQEDGSHPIDQLRWWLGAVEEVSAYVLVVAANRVENDDVASVQLKHRGGAISSLHITMLTHATGEEAYEVYGTKGTLTVNSVYHTTHSMEPLLIRLHRRARQVTDLTLPTAWNVQEEYRRRWQYLKELEHFCECVRSGKEPSVTGEDGRKVVEILNAAYLSACEGRKVRLPLSRVPNLQRMFARLQAASPWRLGKNVWSSRY